MSSRHYLLGMRPNAFTRRLTFGDRVPWAVGLGLVLIFGLSLPAALITRHGASLFELGALVPAHVWHGQVWRLFTWAFLQPSPLGLLFTGLMFWWFGRDLGQEFKSEQLAKIFGGVLLGAGLVTCAIARLDPAVMIHLYLGSYALTASLMVAWGLTFPDRVVRIYFILPIRGFWVAWGTVAVSVIYAIYVGWTHYLPELAAEGLMLAWFYQDELRTWLEKKRQPKGTPKRKGHLRVVSRDDLN